MLLVRRTCKAIGPMRDQPHSRQLHRLSGAGRARRSRPRDHGHGIVTPSGRLSARLTTHATKDPTLCTSSSVARSPAKLRGGAMAEPASYPLSRHRRAEALTPRSRQGCHPTDYRPGLMRDWRGTRRDLRAGLPHRAPQRDTSAQRARLAGSFTTVSTTAPWKALGSGVLGGVAPVMRRIGIEA